jgi:hypothetical protein
MTATEEIQDHQARCQPYLLNLRMLARGEREPTLAAAEVGRATAAIIAEAEAASRAALAAAGDRRRHPGAGTFLQVRLNRLTGTAEEAIAAARDGDAARLRSHLRMFETVTSAIWTVQHAMCSPAVSARHPSTPTVQQPSAGIK